MTKRNKKNRRRRRTNSPAGVLPRPVAQLDIVIPVYGRPDMLRQCLEALERTGGGIQMSLTVVDDKGPDKDREELEEVYESLPIHAKLVRNAKNMGFPFSANAGAAQGSAPFIVFLSTDIVLHDGCLQAMLSEMAANPKTGVVGAKLLFPEVSDDPGRPVGKVQHAGLCVDVQGNIAHANIGWRPDHPKVCQRRVLQAVTGGLLMTRRETWRKVVKYYKSINDPTNGAFNIVYGRGTYEDVEYCIAARGNGYEVVYIPEAVATHHVGASISLCQQGFALGRNATVFRARCGHLLHWDMWRYC